LALQNSECRKQKGAEGKIYNFLVFTKHVNVSAKEKFCW